jgi:glycine cleavage system aminomethyltransferase T
MKQTALRHCHQSAGATWAHRHGWEIPAFFVGAEKEAAGARLGVGIADVSYLGKFEARESQAGSWKLGSKRYLIVGEPPIENPSGGLDVTGVYSAFRMIGPQSRDVLRKVTSLNVCDPSLANGSCGQANLAHVHAILLRDDLGPQLSFIVLVSREYGESTWESILHAGEEFHIVAMGVEALELLRR